MHPDHCALLRTSVSKEPFYKKKMVIHGDFSLKGERQTRRFGARGSTGPANVDLCFFDPSRQGIFHEKKYYYVVGLSQKQKNGHPFGGPVVAETIGTHA